jgi:hypothetical protein
LSNKLQYKSVEDFQKDMAARHAKMTGKPERMSIDEFRGTATPKVAPEATQGAAAPEAPTEGKQRRQRTRATPKASKAASAPDYTMEFVPYPDTHGAVMRWLRYLFVLGVMAYTAFYFRSVEIEALAFFVAWAGVLAIGAAYVLGAFIAPVLERFLSTGGGKWVRVPRGTPSATPK